jgi:ParB-like nuclease domain
MTLSPETKRTMTRAAMARWAVRRQAADAASLSHETNNPPMKEELRHVDPASLGIHPVLQTFPGLAADKLSSLYDSIREQGILTPLVAMEGEHGELLIVAGRNRQKVAIDLFLTEIPVIVRNGVAPLDYALEEAVVGRQLSKSGVALMIFEQHPALQKGSVERGRANLRPGAAHRSDSIGPIKSTICEDGSYRALATRYGFPEDYLTLLASLRAKSDDAHWQLIRKAIFEDDISVTRCIAGQAGRQATAGGKKAETNYLRLAPDGRCIGVMPKALASLRNGFEKWTTLDLNARAGLKAEWDALMEILPEDLAH